ncbi:MAG: InlB B-repeat-containing protein, partial [Lachnospiraceae bacterium]|nr:InlB B-repeat-containing protein [Lachnospiraceae bacterium]
SLNVALDDLSAQTVSFTMPETDVTILATYTAAVAETTAETTAETAAEITAETTAAEEEIVIVSDDSTAATAESETAAAVESETAATAESETAAAVESETTTTYTVTVDGTALSGAYAEGDTVTITPPAATAVGTAFSSWTITTAGDNKTVAYTDNGDGTYSFTMPADNVIASSVFDEVPYTVTVVNGTTGTSGAASATYYYGESVSIAAAAAPDGQTFDHWTSTGTTEVTFTNSSSATTTFTMPAGNVEVTAVYVNEPNTYTVKVSNGLIDGTYTENTYEEGTQITVTANTSASGEEFSGWTVNDGAYDLGESASSSTVTVTVDQNLTFVANYTGIKYSVMVTNGSADYTETTAGTTVTITADAPATGYAFDSWTVGTQNVTLANASKSTTTFTMPSADVSVTANYRKVQYTVTVENGNANATYFYYGDTVTISSNYPASGKVFSAWTATSGNVTFTDASKASTTFTMPASDVTISATYEDAPTGADNYISGIEEGGSYVANDKLTFTPVGAGMSNTDPNPGDVRYVPTGYTIGNVSNTWSSSPYETSMSIKKTGEYTLTVTFERQVYDGSSWVADGTTTTTSVTFNIVESLESVQTGDDTPIMQVVVIAVVACLIFIVLLVVFIRRRRRDEE